MRFLALDAIYLLDTHVMSSLHHHSVKRKCVSILYLILPHAIYHIRTISRNKSNGAGSYPKPPIPCEQIDGLAGEREESLSGVGPSLMPKETASWKCLSYISCLVDDNLVERIS